jgi:hypothetical protein
MEGDEGQTTQAQLAAKGSAPGSSIPPSALIGSAKFENRKTAAKEPEKKSKTVSKARLTHIERLQSALDGTSIKIHLAGFTYYLTNCRLLIVLWSGHAPFLIAIVKYGDDSDLDGPDDMLTATQSLFP